MFQRFASALFGDDVEELSRSGRPGDGKEEEDEDWILVNYLGKTDEEEQPLFTCISHDADTASENILPNH